MRRTSGIVWTAILLSVSLATASRALDPTNTGAAEATKFKIDESAGGKLVTTTAPITVLAEPEPGSRILHTYAKGAMMVILGQAVGTSYLYVSPCNACDRGFVPKAEMLAKSTE